MFFTLSKTLDVLLSPLAWAILLALGAALGDVRHRVRYGLGAALVLLAFSSEIVSSALLRRLESESRPTVRTNVTYDAVVLLGGLVERPGDPASGGISYNDNVERLLATYDLLRTGRARHVIVSGGSYPAEVSSEARVLGDQLEAWGIDRARIVLDERAMNTNENAVESARIARERGYRSLLLVTSAFHMPRALDCFRAVDLEVDALPVDFRAAPPERVSALSLPRTDHLKDSTYAIREIAGRFVYRATGRGK